LADRRRPRRQAPAPDARALAWDILQRVEAGAYADALLGHRLRSSGLGALDQALATRLVYGTLTWQAHLDFVISAFARRAPEQLDPPVRAVLRLALFQICHLSKIPAFAAVDTAVQLAKRYRGGAAVSFVNAVLRRAATGWRTVPLPSRESDPLGHVAIASSHPRWLVEQWAAAYGLEETEQLLRANNEPAPTVLRVNRLRTDRDVLLAQLHAAGHTAEATVYSPDGIVVRGGGGPENLPGYRDGLFSLQGEASQLIACLLDAQPGQRLLDACASPGGKSTHLAELSNNHAEIVALDAAAKGIERTAAMAVRLGITTIYAQVADALTWQDNCAAGQNDGGFDGVLLDAPCSGFGTLRAHPEVKWRRTADDVTELAGLQARLLRRVAEHVKPGGKLVYATCTVTAAENDDNLVAFLRDRPDFHLDDPRPSLPEAARGLVSDDRLLRTFPHRQGLDGFFAARLRRQG